MTNPSQSVLAAMAHAAHESPEGAKALLLVLRDSGDLPEPFNATASLEPESIEHEVADFFHDGGITRVYFDGTIEQFPN